MVNKLYSLLVSGCDYIPNTCSTWRKYTQLPHKASDILPASRNALQMSIYACYIIKLAKTSRLYSYILDKDPINTYEADPVDVRLMPDTTLVFPYSECLDGYRIIGGSRHVPKHIRDQVNTDDPADLAALLCLSLLYTGIL